MPMKKREEHRIIHGDCIKELRKIKDNSVDLIITDPPFNIGKKYNFICFYYII